MRTWSRRAAQAVGKEVVSYSFRLYFSSCFAVLPGGAGCAGRGRRMRGTEGEF
jgi:hypothetical protein